MDTLVDETNFAQEPQKTVSLNSAARSRIQRAIQGQLREMDIEESAWWLLDLLKEEDFLVAQGGSTPDARLASLLERWWQQESAEIQKNCKWMQKHGLPVAFLCDLQPKARFARRPTEARFLEMWSCHLLFLFPIQRFSLALCLALPGNRRLSEGKLQNCIQNLALEYKEWEKENKAWQNSLERLQKFIMSQGSLSRLTHDFRKPLANLMLSHENLLRLFGTLANNSIENNSIENNSIENNSIENNSIENNSIENVSREKDSRENGSAKHSTNESYKVFQNALRRFGDQIQLLEGYTHDLYYLLTGEQAIEGEVEEFILKDLCDGICEQLQKNYATHKKIKILWEKKFDGISRMHRRYAFRILYNLIENAYKFSAPLGVVHISIEKKGNWIRIDIEDNGKGFYLRDDDFELARLNLDQTAGSWGIALAASYELTRRMGGRLVRRRPRFGQGARFLLVLPNHL